MNEQTIFTAAIEREPAERSAFLDGVCGENKELRERVEKLIGLQANAGNFLEQPAAGASPTLDQPLLERPGTLIGPYKLLQQIGEGGMGVVYMAEQTEPIARRVALKVIKPGMDSRQVIARFDAERQALSMMDHVNISRVLDAGTTDAGRPYFVMELVHGVPITQYCDDQRLTPRQRLELFVLVCQAIQHAHQKGIIHRDIKPSNVMVTLYDGQPVPKVIDFGVAKATEQKLTERTLFTQYGTMVGTLEYMSPEQAEMSALGVDTRSDIFSLGVLLYELLTGSTPLSHKRFKDAAYGEILRMIKEEEAPKPSTRLSDSGEALASISANRHTQPAKLSKLMRGDLDWIVMKSLEKDRSRRYETANGFAADVRRYLNDEPVQACPPSASYRFRKFARRNKRALASAAALALAILVVAGTIGWAVRDRDAQAQEVTRERAAREAAIQAEVNLALKEAQRWQEQAHWPEALSAAKRAEALLAGGGSDELREQVRQLRKDLDIVLRLDELRALWGEHPGHESQDLAYARVFADFGIDVKSLGPSEVAARIRRRPGTAVRVAAGLDDWAMVLRDWGVRDRTRDPATWKGLLEAARLADPDPWRSELRQLMGREDLNALRKLADSSDIPALPVQSLQLMGNALIFGGDRPACVAWLRKAHREHPGDPLISFDLAFHLSHLPSADWVEVLRFAEAALAARPQSASMYNMVGRSLDRLGRHDEAMVNYRRSLELKPDFDSSHNNLGEALAAQGNLDEAIACYRKCIELSPKWSWAHANLATALGEQGKLDEAAAVYRSIVAADGDNPAAWVRFGLFYAELGQQEQAAECFAEAIAPKTARRPPLAAIPFSANEAARLQRAWADHLGVPVEFENSLGMKFRLIPPGVFDMGTPPEVRQQIVEELRRQGIAEYLVRPHEEEGLVRVFLTAPYYMARCEVTVEQFRKFVIDTGYQTTCEKKGVGGFAARKTQWVRHRSHVWTSPSEGWELKDNQPVVHISWTDAVAFCDWLKQKDNRPYALPTEAQWEFACRGGSSTVYGTGDDPSVLEAVAWTRETCRTADVQFAQPVGTKQANSFALHDMLGNAFEWCADWYAPGTTGSNALLDPLNSEVTGRRVARGGAWFRPGPVSRCGHRIGWSPSEPNDAGHGFRIAIVGDLKRVASPTASPEQSTPTSK